MWFNFDQLRRRGIFFKLTESVFEVSFSPGNISPTKILLHLLNNVFDKEITLEALFPL